VVFQCYYVAVNPDSPLRVGKWVCLILLSIVVQDTICVLSISWYPFHSLDLKFVHLTVYIKSMLARNNVESCTSLYSPTLNPDHEIERILVRM
jgi:hypothetical protein